MLCWQYPLTGNALTHAFLQQVESAPRAGLIGKRTTFTGGTDAAFYHHGFYGEDSDAHWIFYFHDDSGVDLNYSMEVGLKWKWSPPATPELQEANICLHPTNPEDFIAMQGLLVALMGESQETLQAGDRSFSLETGKVSIVWEGSFWHCYNKLWTLRV